MSPELRQYLADWLHWAENGAPDEKPFWRNWGLCPNAQSEAITDELSTLLGGNWYPFGRDDYSTRRRDHTQHECPKRLAWVREQLAKVD